MTRVTVYRYDEEGRSYAGHFNTESAERFLNAEDNEMWEDTRLHTELFRTKGGRWVRCDWDQWQGSEAKHWFISDDEARQWLLTEKQHEAVEKYFGELEEESGPNLGGRPSIGPKVDVRIPKDILARVDAFKGTRDRADALRDLIAAGLDVIAPVSATEQ